LPLPSETEKLAAEQEKSQLNLFAEKDEQQTV
jgi:hypothetical protein